jgi:hypothetical protein
MIATFLHLYRDKKNSEFCCSTRKALLSSFFFFVQKNLCVNFFMSFQPEGADFVSGYLLVATKGFLCSS